MDKYGGGYYNENMKVLERQLNSRHCIVCGMENPSGLKAPFYNMEDGSVVSVFSFDFNHQSYPERVHGGLISAMLDEIIGRSLWVTEKDTYAVTTSLEITYRKPVPYGEKLLAKGFITNNSSHWFSAEGFIYNKNGNLLAQGKGRYLKLPPDKISAGSHADEEMCYDIKDGVTEISFPLK